MQRYRHDPSKSLVGFVVGDVEYAVAIARVKEIANPLNVVGLPHAPRSVVGVADYRGEVVSVVDLRARFGLPATTHTRKTKWIVVDVGPREGDGDAPVAPPAPATPAGQTRAPARDAAVGRLVALVVDAVTGVFGTSGAELRPPPELGSGDDARGIAGVTTNANGLVFVLDPTRLRDLARAMGKGAAGPSLPPPRRGRDPDEQSPTAASAPAVIARTPT
jgi:purine-binding chemotaxis protein CheW